MRPKLTIPRSRARRVLDTVLAAEYAIPPAPTELPVIRGSDLRVFTGPPEHVGQGCILRALPCLLCGQAVGGRTIRLVALVAALPRQTGPHGLQSRAYLVCAWHFPVPDLDLHKRAHQIENLVCGCGWCA